MSGRSIPPISQKEADRHAALLALDVPAMRRWMALHGFGAQGNDQVVLISMHETRVIDLEMPEDARQASRAWLREHYPASSVQREGSTE